MVLILIYLWFSSYPDLMPIYVIIKLTLTAAVLNYCFTLVIIKLILTAAVLNYCFTLPEYLLYLQRSTLLALRRVNLKVNMRRVNLKVNMHIYFSLPYFFGKLSFKFNSMWLPTKTKYRKYRAHAKSWSQGICTYFLHHITLFGKLSF